MSTWSGTKDIGCLNYNDRPTSFFFLYKNVNFHASILHIQNETSVNNQVPNGNNMNNKILTNIVIDVHVVTLFKYYYRLLVAQKQTGDLQKKHSS